MTVAHYKERLKIYKKTLIECMITGLMGYLEKRT